MKDQKGESADVEVALEIIRSEQDKEYELKVSRDTLFNLSGLILVVEITEREDYTDPKYTNHIPLEDYQERLGPTLLYKFFDAWEHETDELGKMSISLCYRDVNALALASVGRPIEEEKYGKKFWEAVLEGRLDHHRMIERGRSLYPHVLETVVSFVEAGGNDQYILCGFFERLSNMGYRQEGAVE